MDCLKFYTFIIDYNFKPIEAEDKLLQTLTSSLNKFLNRVLTRGRSRSRRICLVRCRLKIIRFRNTYRYKLSHVFLKCFKEMIPFLLAMHFCSYRNIYTSLTFGSAVNPRLLKPGLNLALFRRHMFPSYYYVKICKVL
jgi:hypothetical protein